MSVHWSKMTQLFQNFEVRRRFSSNEAPPLFPRVHQQHEWDTASSRSDRCTARQPGGNSRLSPALSPGAALSCGSGSVRSGNKCNNHQGPAPALDSLTAALIWLKRSPAGSLTAQKSFCLANLHSYSCGLLLPPSGSTRQRLLLYLCDLIPPT